MATSFASPPRALPPPTSWRHTLLVALSATAVAVTLWLLLATWMRAWTLARVFPRARAAVSVSSPPAAHGPDDCLENGALESHLQCDARVERFRTGSDVHVVTVRLRIPRRAPHRVTEIVEPRFLVVVDPHVGARQLAALAQAVLNNEAATWLEAWQAAGDSTTSDDAAVVRHDTVYVVAWEWAGSPCPALWRARRVDDIAVSFGDARAVVDACRVHLTDDARLHARQLCIWGHERGALVAAPLAEWAMRQYADAEDALTAAPRPTGSDAGMSYASPLSGVLLTSPWRSVASALSTLSGVPAPLLRIGLRCASLSDGDLAAVLARVAPHTDVQCSDAPLADGQSIHDVVVAPWLQRCMARSVQRGVSL